MDDPELEKLAESGRVRLRRMAEVRRGGRPLLPPDPNVQPFAVPCTDPACGSRSKPAE